MNCIFRLLGVSLLGLVLAACSLQPATPTATDEPEIETQANFYKQFGGNLSTPGLLPPDRQYTSAIDLDSSDNPVVALCVCAKDQFTELDFVDFGAIAVKRYNPATNSWNQVGNAIGVTIGNSLYSQGTNVSFNWAEPGDADRPVVAWTRISSVPDPNDPNLDLIKKDIRMNYYNPITNTWNQMGSGTFNINEAQDADNPSIGVDQFGGVELAWNEAGNVYVKAVTVLTGNVVRTATLDMNLGQIAANPSLALDSLGRPVVGWEEFDNASNSWNVYVKRWNGFGWVSLGGALDMFSDTNAVEASLAVDSSDNPVVAWREWDGLSDNIYVKRWDGSSWVQVGTAYLDRYTNRTSYAPSLALDSLDNPVVSWQEQDLTATSFDIFASRWTGTTWQRQGSVFDVTKANQATVPALALDSKNFPIIAFREGAYDVYVKGYFANIFVPYGDSIHFVIDDDSTNPSIALGLSNKPIVAWQEYEGTSFYHDIFVRRWDGTSWPAVGNTDIKVSLAVSNDAISPSLAAETTTGNPVIAWAEGPGGLDSYNIQVQRWSDSAFAWVNYGSSTPLNRATTNNATDPAVALDGTNKPYVAWVETVNGSRNIYVKRWTGTAWAWVGTAAALDIAIANSVGAPSLAIGTDNKPVIAWAEEDASGNSNIYVKRLVGNTWTLVGTTAIDRSINQYAESPSLDLDSNNNPIVAWSEFFLSQFVNSFAVTVKRWNGSSWVDVGTLLDKVASAPSLSIGSNNNPVVTYSKSINANSNIYAKRWTGTTWQLISTGALDVNLAQNAGLPSMVLNAANNPIVAWYESTQSQGQNIYVKGF